MRVKAVRALLAAVFFAGFAAGSVVWGFLLFPLADACCVPAAAARRKRAFVRWGYRLFVGIGRLTGLFRVVVSEADRRALAHLKGCVVVAPHPSLIDVIILLAHLGDATAIAKVAAAHNPFYGRIVRGAFLVRDDPEQVLRASADVLSGGGTLVVFPEGTRTRGPIADAHLHRGAAQIALTAGCAIQPLDLACDPPVLAKGQPWHDVGARTVTYTLRVLPPIDPVPDAPSRHAAAVALTAAIRQAFAAKSTNQGPCACQTARTAAAVSSGVAPQSA